ncbi:MAG: hypothetical protein IT292_09915 [Deltaproteobacteria bacterium]|nr:hypothetical protein [Deltaproteobacteria bacterium]
MRNDREKQKYKIGSFEYFVNVLFSPISWRDVRDFFFSDGSSQGTNKHTNNYARSTKPYIIEVSGQLEIGKIAEYAIDHVDFEVNENTCIVGDMNIGAITKAKLAMVPGKNPVAKSVVFIKQFH